MPSRPARSLSLVALATVVLAPALVHAQDLALPPPSASFEGLLSGGGGSGGSAAQRAEESRPRRWPLDALAGLGAGIGLELVGSIPGGLIALSGSQSCSSGGGCETQNAGLVVLAIGGFAGLVLGEGIGVAAAGHALDGRGSVGIATLGALAGVAGGFAVSMVGLFANVPWLTVTGIGVEYVAGPLMAQGFYELSSDAALRSPRGSSARIAPSTIPLYASGRLAGVALGVTAVAF